MELSEISGFAALADCTKKENHVLLHRRHATPVRLLPQPRVIRMSARLPALEVNSKAIELIANLPAPPVSTSQLLNYSTGQPPSGCQTTPLSCFGNRFA